MKAVEEGTYLTVYKYLHSVYSVFSVFAVRSVLIQLPIQSPEGRAHCVISHFLRVWPFFFKAPFCNLYEVTVFLY